MSHVSLSHVHSNLHLCDVIMLQTSLTHLNLDARCVGDHTLQLLRPLSPYIKELDLYGARVTSKGVSHLLCFSGLSRLDLCSGLLTGELISDRFWYSVVYTRIHSIIVNYNSLI